MLRTKTLGTLSHCARSFLLSSSRCNSAHGASCTCSDDDNCVSRRQLKSTDFELQKNKSTLVSEAADKAGSPSYKDAIRVVSHQQSESLGYSASVSHVLSPSNSSLRLEALSSLNGEASTIDYVIHAAQKKIEHSSKMAAEHLVMAGIATVGLLSGLVNHGNPTLNGSGLASQLYMIDSTKPLPHVNPSSGRPRKRGSHFKVQSNPPSNVPGVSKTNSSSIRYEDPKTKSEKPAVIKPKQAAPTGAPSISAETGRSRMSSQVQRQCIPQKDKSHSYRFSSDTKPWRRISEGKALTDKVQSPMRFKKGQGVSPSVIPFMNAERAIGNYTHLLRQLKWGPAAEEALGNMHYNLDCFQANKVLKNLKDHTVALGFFNWLKHQPGFKHDQHTYTTVIGILGQAREFGYVRRLVEEMVRNRCPPTTVTYNRLIHAYGRANYIDESVNLFYRMQEAGCEPDRITYCTLIDIHAKAGFLESAMDLYQKMQEEGLSPDTFTYSVMINCLGKAGHPAAAYKLFWEMVGQGCVPNIVTYNIMIALQAKARNYGSALKLYRNMQEVGLRPDKITYNIVMEVLGHCGQLDEVESVFAEMKQDWVPDEPVYGLLVDMWGKAGNVDKAQAWYKSMLDAGLQPNVPTCNSLLSAFLRVNRLSDAHDLLQSMLRFGLDPSLQTYTLLLSFCTESQSHMGFCCELMTITGHPAHTFLLSLPAAEPGGQNVRQHAGAFLDLMHSEERESKRGLVDVVVDFLHKSGLKEEAGLVWEVASQRNVYPDAVREKTSAYWLINLHVMSDGTAVTALSRTLAWFRRQMLDTGVRPNRIDIITGWGRRSRVTGTSLVRQSVCELLHLFRFPLVSENGNSGCFVGCGEALSRWLLQPYVERMHLL